MKTQKKFNKKGRRKKAYFLIINLILSVVAISSLISLAPVVTATDYKAGDKFFDEYGWREIKEKFKIGDGWTSPRGTKWTLGEKGWTTPGIDGSVTSDKILTWEDEFALHPEKYGTTAETTPSASTTPTTGGSSWLSEQLGIKDAPTTLSPTGDKITSGEFFSFQTGGAVDAIVSGAQYALVTYGIISMIGPMFGLSKEQVSAASKAAAFGMFTGKTLYTVLGKKGAWSQTGVGKWITAHGGAGLWSVGAGALVAYLLYRSLYKSEDTEVVSFECDVWDAPTGGAKCGECNKQGILPCSEYQCRSLGQACQLLNPGTDEEKCTWVNRKDVNPPEIQPWEDALLEDYEYKPDNTISPPDRGVRIENTQSTTGCVKAFTPLTFGINVNEPAKCKLDYIRKQNFSDMEFYFGGSSTFKYNHSQIMSLPGASALASENLTIQNDGEFELYTRCQDANGNSNTANFVFKFCVEEGPDTTPPLIVTTDLLNNMPIAYNTTEVDLEVYTNEPADCKWSHIDQSYDNMEETMSCSSSIFEMNAQMLYKCSTTLTGLKNRVENNFYFRCQDKSENKNVNAESYEFILIGTQPLVIDEVGPNGTIRDSTESIKVTLEAETSAGYKEGEAFCYYSDTGDEDSYILFFETESYEHSQELWLAEGDYTYYIKCIDLGGNQDNETVNFNVESDSSSPTVVRVYHEETYLKLVTDEKAECVYDTTDCSYALEDGIKFSVVDDTEHYIDWNTQVDFYIKCEDEFGNQPFPNKCSIIVRPFEVY